ncbi:phage protein NinX family protein [Pseudomonas aeruginosa]|uniref:phage protein NinX family protein n=1 Tax=Pseudomonas aeruginosa TaxID=287 RepID=UPI000F81C6BB|nr:phage protein NinX family protein [Pseudomonas aeruginosa]EIU4992730.1 DUF2591 domain-containing protein [Pseudomonas aeruginosa]EIY2608859.1 DUF2591 family protein [Pseudomonas aeruginosa]EIY2740375.1 DUF2591 family protein [Pseudomonas aeruginosa]EKM0198671.1 DUF2591 family protein [Pseudomonas aeruginosa]EKM0218303.1 DUF2591 family protein [Pseudomonas aeruginosa]
MSETVEVKTFELEGQALDWAVGCIEDEQIERKQIGWLLMNLKVWVPLPDTPYFDIVTHWSPSTDWSQGGPLIQQYGCDLNCLAPANAWEANCWDSAVPQPDLHICEGETPLIAVCRAIVRAKLGDTVKIPAELIK